MKFYYIQNKYHILGVGGSGSAAPLSINGSAPTQQGTSQQRGSASDSR